MEAKDTVIDKEKRRLIRAHWLGRKDRPIHDDLIKDAAEAQAEISFKAGIREVVEWIEWTYRDGHIDWCGVRSDWQAKLKEWGRGG